MPKKDRVSTQKRKLLEQASAARGQKKLTYVSVVNNNNNPTNNNQSCAETPEELHNAEEDGEDIELDYLQEQIEFEPTIEHNVQDVEWIKTEEEFTWTIRYLGLHIIQQLSFIYYTDTKTIFQAIYINKYNNVILEVTIPSGVLPSAYM